MSEIAKLAVLASGQGTNLQALLDQTKRGTVPGELKVVISDKKDAYALVRAKEAGVEAIHLSPKDYSSREAYDVALVENLKTRKIDWVILAGFMRILSPAFVRSFPKKIINVHPALLPKYPGTHSIERAYKDHEKKVGVTVHFVDEGVDTGPMILQEGIDVRPGETLEELTERVHALEHRLLPQAVTEVIQGKR